LLIFVKNRFTLFLERTIIRNRKQEKQTTNISDRPAPHRRGIFEECIMKIVQFIIAAVFAASIGALFGGSYASLPQVYQSYSTKQFVGWEDSEGYHDCRKQACILPESYDLIWVE